MLNITPTAVTLLNRARTEKGAPDDFGVRFFATEAADSGRTRLGFRFVDSPSSDDTILEEDHIKAFVAPEVERLIGDVTVDAENHDGQMGLVLRRAKPQA